MNKAKIKTVRDLLGTRQRYSYQMGTNDLIRKYLDRDIVCFSAQYMENGDLCNYYMIFKGDRTYFAIHNGERGSLHWVLKRIEGNTFVKKESGKKFQKWLLLKG